MNRQNIFYIKYHPTLNNTCYKPFSSTCNLLFITGALLKIKKTKSLKDIHM